MQIWRASRFPSHTPFIIFAFLYRILVFTHNLKKNRCTSGELFQAVLDGKPREILRNIAAFYDYLEIQPTDTFLSVFENDKTLTQEQLFEYNGVLVDLGAELNIPVCATGNVFFCDPEDEVYRRILMYGRGVDNADDKKAM